MKDIYQVLREKEQAIVRLRQEVEALRFCLPMLAEMNELSSSPAVQTSAVPANRWPAETKAEPANPFHN